MPAWDEIRHAREEDDPDTVEAALEADRNKPPRAVREYLRSHAEDLARLVQEG